MWAPESPIIGGDGRAQNFLELLTLGAVLRVFDDKAAIVDGSG
jgi:hypothetical protein